MQKYYMGIDTGTNETKGVLLDSSGKIVAIARHSHEIENPKPNHFELDAEGVFWHDFCFVSNQLLQTSRVDPKEIHCLGISAMGPDIIPVDEECKALRKAILYGIDARAHQEIEWLNRYYGRARALELFGYPICSDNAAPKILWLKNNEPEIYQKTHKFLTGTSYLCAKLTGNYVIDRFLATADFKPMYNDAGEITDEALLFCRKDQLATTADLHEIAGRITPEAASATGLAVGTLVNVGSGDASSEAISCGVVQPGDMMIQLGSTMFVYYCSSVNVVNEVMRGGPYVIPNTYKLSAGTNAAGNLTQYLRNNFFRDLYDLEKNGGEEAYTVMSKLAGEIQPGSNGLIMLPYLAGERSPIEDPRSTGMILGLSLHHNRNHILRAALESVAFSARQILDCIRALNFPVESIMITGGGSKNEIWLQIFADVLRIPISTPKITLGACYADALVAMLASGEIKDFSELRSMIQTDKVYTPNPYNSEIYEDYLKIFTDLYYHNKDFMHKLHNRQLRGKLPLTNGHNAGEDIE